MSEQPTDFRSLPPDVPREETVAYQLQAEQRFGGPEGGGDVVGAVGTDGDGD